MYRVLKGPGQVIVAVGMKEMAGLKIFQLN